MKQIIPFKKDITFKSVIGELTSISLDNDLQLKGEDLVVGNFYIKGRYKLTKASQIEEEFSYKIPCEISISDSYDTFDSTIDIDDFYYEIKDEQTLEVNISVCIDNLVKKEEMPEEKSLRKEEENKETLEEKEILEEKEKEEKRPIEKKVLEKNDSCYEKEDEEETLKETGRKEIKKEEEINPFSILQETKKEIFSSTDTYSCYYVYLVQEDDSIDKILNKYKITKEDLALYNDINDIKKGTKLIIPDNG